VQPDSVRVADVEPSLTVTLQSAGAAKLEEVILKPPAESAVPVSVPPFTINLALGVAPDPSILTCVP
jgi:hypothetical protein